MAERLCPYNPLHGSYSDEDLLIHLREKHAPQVAELMQHVGEMIDNGQATPPSSGDPAACDDPNGTNGPFCCRFSCHCRFDTKEDRDIHEEKKHLGDALEVILNGT